MWQRIANSGWRIAAGLLLLCLLLRAALPTLPLYVCAGMGGLHLLRPCCPSPVDTVADDADEDAAHDALAQADQRGDDTHLSARCCERSDLPRLTLQRAPRPLQIPSPPPHASADVALVFAAPLTPLHPSPTALLHRLTHAAAIGPPPPLRPVLRI